MFRTMSNSPMAFVAALFLLKPYRYGPSVHIPTDKDINAEPFTVPRNIIKLPLTNNIFGRMVSTVEGMNLHKHRKTIEYEKQIEDGTE